MKAKRLTVSVATDASENFSATTDVVDGPIALVRYVPDASTPLATGADLTITGADTGTVVLTVADIGTSAVTWAPRTAAHDAADGAALLFAGAGEAVTSPVVIVGERLSVVVAQGGATKLGKVYITTLGG